MEEWQELNNRIGEQLITLIEGMHGKSLPFILIMPPTTDDLEAQLVTNVENIKFIRSTLKQLEKSLGKVDKLNNAYNSVQ